MPQPSEAAIPKYFLYGDADSEPELDTLHIEAIHLRSGAHSWTIPAHSHPDHLQLLLVERGGGEISIEAQRFEIVPTAFLVVPAAMVHRIGFLPDTDGYVITAALAYSRQVTQGDVAAQEAVAGPGIFLLQPDGPEAALLRGAFAGIAREYVWAAPSRRMAIAAEFQRIIVTTIRLRAARGLRDLAVSDRDYDILCRYREEIEAHYRDEKGLDFYAAQIGVAT